MSEAQSPTGHSPTGHSPSLPPVLTPLRRGDDDHAPSIPSPLNPDAPSRMLSKAPMGRGSYDNLPKTPLVREQREKKDSLKKRESVAAAKGSVAGDIGRPSALHTPKTAKNVGSIDGVTTPMRYSLHAPESSHYNTPRNTAFASHEPNPMFAPDGKTELKRPVDHAENKRAYRYSHCVADPLFPHKQYYRQSEIAPFGARFSVEDSDKNVHFDPVTLRIVTNEKGWRSSRANVYAREGSMYYEVKILKGIPADDDASAASYSQETTPQPHVRFGWARREAPLDAPIGFDGYSYGIVDTKFDTVHRSRPGKLFTGSSLSHKPAKTAAKGKGKELPAQLPVKTGDVIGLLITLPPLPLHHKIVSGSYNPAVDFSTAPDPHAVPPDIIRDRIPVPYRGNMYFEALEYQTTKPMIAYTDRNAVFASGSNSGSGAGSSGRPHPNHEDVQLRTLPGSSIKVWRNGVPVGTAFDNLLAFLPPASSMGSASHLSRQNLDDGTLGYYPFVSAFWGGVAEINLGPEFWCPPEGLGLAKKVAEPDGDVSMGDVIDDGGHDAEKPRGVGERYKEQIAEDVVWDLLDEATFYAQDGGEQSAVPQTTAKSTRNHTPREM